MAEFDLRSAFDAGVLFGLELASGAPVSLATLADAAQRALDVRLVRQAADERLRRLDAAEREGEAAYDRERAAQGLLPYQRARAA